MFNQGETLWAGLENYLLNNAATFDRRLVVFTGCVLDSEDPLYRGVQLPLRFFKVAAFLDARDLAATGYVLDQTPLVQDLPTVLADAATAGNPPPLGPFRTFQVPITDIATLTGLDLTALAAADRLPVPTAATGSTTRPCGDRSGPLTTSSGGGHQSAAPVEAGHRCRHRGATAQADGRRGASSRSSSGAATSSGGNRGRRPPTVGAARGVVSAAHGVGVMREVGAADLPVDVAGPGTGRASFRRQRGGAAGVSRTS